MSESQQETQPLLRPQDVENTPVYPIIHMIRADVIHYIDTPLSYESLTSPDLTYTLVRPLVDKYSTIQEGNLSVVFCCLINRVYFIRDDNMTTATISRSRAALCEILATGVFRANANNILRLTMALTTSWPVYSGADPDLITRAREERDDDLEDRVGNAIELAILGKAKKFIKSSACQKVIDAIWTGKCVYQAESSHSILSDTYKRNPIHFYDPHKAPLLDHYRLKVPSIRAVLEYVNFLILFLLFVIAIEFNDRDRINASEFAFMIYALGFTLEKVAAMQEHGIKVYFKGTWNGFDLAFITTFIVYGSLRLYGIYHHKTWACIYGIDVLALIACLVFPRLAFVTFKDNLLVLSLRAMIIQFIFLMIIAAFCFCGFLYALWTLSRDEASYGVGLITWWMLDLWFGLDASGFDKATTFHPVFGPALMVTYACLSNTLLLTVLVSILSNTFASVNEDAAAEAMFRKAVSTIEGVKADSLFSYQPPINLVALCIMLPASYILSPRWFHKVNVFMIRLTSFPILLVISFYERQSKQAGALTFYDTFSHMADRVLDTLPRSIKRMTFFEGLVGVGADIDAVFELEDEYESALDTGDNDAFSIRNQSRRLSGASSGRGRPNAPGSPPKIITRTRLNSMMSRTDTYSPLAQVFNPFVLDDDESREFNGAATGVSYGPASRRRMTSITQSAQQRRVISEGLQVKKFPTVSDTQELFRSKSHERYSHLVSSPSATAQEINSNEEPSNDAILSRLEDMEKRQKRIEHLLTQISYNLNKSVES